MSNSRRVLFFCQVFYPDDQATSVLFTELFNTINEKSITNTITVLSGYPSSSARNIDASSKHKKFEVYRNIKIIRCGFNLDIKKSYLNRLLVYLSYSIESFIRGLTMRSDLISGTTNPFINLWTVSIISFIKKTRSIYIFLDIFPEGLIAVKKLKEKSVITYFLKFLNKLSLKYIDEVIVIGRDMENIIKKYNYDRKRIQYIPHWSSTKPNYIISYKNSKFYFERGLENKFTVQYSGNMGLWHDMNTYIKVAKLLENNTDVIFNMVGNGIKKKEAFQKSIELKLRNINWYDFVPKEDLESSLAACNVALISLDVGLEGIAVPSKLYGILASGRPIIASVPKESEIAYTIQDHKCGFVLNPGDSEGLARVIIECANQEYDLQSMGKNSYQAFENNFNTSVAADSFLDIFDK